MTAQGPMQLQQIQTPSGPQLIAIPQNQSLSFPPNSVLVQGPTPNTLQLPQSSGNTLQLRQSPSAIIQSNTFPQTSLPNQMSLQSQIFPANNASATSGPGMKRDEKGTPLVDGSVCVPGLNEQKKIVIDNKQINSKKNVNIVQSNNNSNTNNTNNNSFNKGNVISNSSNCNTNNTLINSNTVVNTLIGKESVNRNAKSERTNNVEENVLINRTIVTKNFGKADNLCSTPVSVQSTPTTQKNITSSLRQIRTGSLANRNKQMNQSTETKEKSEESKSLCNLTRIIDSVASNTEHLISPPPPKSDNNLPTSAANSGADDIIKSPPSSDDIISKLSLNDVFMTGNKSLNLNKRPNLTIVQKHSKVIQSDVEETNIGINRLIMSPSSNNNNNNNNSGSNLNVDFENLTENYDTLEMKGMTASAGVQTQGFVSEHNASSNQNFPTQEETKKGKKKSSSKKKGKKEENRVDLWDLMKSAGLYFNVILYV